MQTIGLIGGMSWESTTEYYRLLNQEINTRLGGLHSAKIVMISIDFQPMEAHMQRGEWDQCENILSDAARKLESAGADCFLICTNTLHKVAPGVSEAVHIPLLHIVDAAAVKIKSEQLHTVGLLGTKFTMEEQFYRGMLKEKHGLDVITPPAEDRQLVHDIIFNELCHGTVRDQSRVEYMRIIDTMSKQGAEGVIEGCTEIAMLVNQSHTDIPLFDTTTLHVQHAVHFALNN